MKKTTVFLVFSIVVSFQPCGGGEAVKPLMTWGGHDHLSDLVLHAEGKILATAGFDDKLIKIWQFPEGKQLATLEGHANRISRLAFSPDGRMLASVSQEAVNVWEVGTWKILQSFEGNPNGRAFWSVRSLLFSPDNKSLYLAHNRSIRRWTLGEKKDEEIVACKGPLSWFYVLQLPEHKVLGANLWQTIEGLRVELWDLPSGKLRKTLKADDLNVVCLAVSPDGKTLAGGSIEECLHLWDIPSGKHLAKIKQPGQVGFVVFSPDSKTLAVSYKPDRTKRKPGAFLLMDVASGKEVVRLAKAHEHGCSCRAFSPDGRKLVSGAKTLKVWDLETLRKMKK
jgi:WD40 repeat protein